MVRQEGFFGSTVYSVLVFLVLLTTLALSMMAFYNSKQLKDFIIPKPLDVEDFMAKLKAHPEMSQLSENPLNIVQVTSANLPNLQAQIGNLDTSFLGSFLVQYKDFIVVYNYLNDTVKGTIDLRPLFPQDFFEKLLKHPELKAYQSQQPSGGGVLDQTTLDTIKQQQPDIFRNAQVGQYLVIYQDRVFVVDYEKDRIVVNSKLPAQQPVQ
jgi:hypothetical protein